MKKNSKICSLLMALLMVFSLSLTGCGDRNDTGTAASTSVENPNQSAAAVTSANQSSAAVASEDVKWDTSKKKKIVLSTIKDYYTTALQQIAKDYTALHPETEVEIQIMGDNTQYTQNFTTKISTDKTTAPDIIHANLIAGNTEGDLINKGWIMGLDELLEESNPYNNGQKVRNAFSDPFYLTAAVSSAGKVGHLPFDLVGVGCFYNKDIFDKAGVKAPETYEDLDIALATLQKAGYEHPIGGQFTGWFANSLIDWGYRKMETDFLVLPGDGIYDENTMSANTNIVYNPDDATFDTTAIFNQEKIVAYADKNGIDSPLNKKIWELLKSVYKYCAPGWLDADDGQVYNQFIAGQLPVYVNGSWNVGKLVSDVSKLSDDKKFKWAVFKFPKLKNADADFSGEPRGLLVAGHKIGIVNKDDKDIHYRASDFLKYMYSPEIAAKIYDITLSKGELVQGPSLIKGVKLSDEINGYLEGFKVAGTMRWDLIPLHFQYTESNKPKFFRLEYDYFENKITYDEYIKGLSNLEKEYIKEQVKSNGFDLDPKTKDTPPAAK